MENAYDVAAAFRRIEDDLIRSMIRNFEHHKAMEAAEGIEWTQWQIEQLAALEEFKRRNQTKYAGEFKDINESIERIILHAKQIGMDEQEMQILNAIKRGAKLTKGSMTGEFFKINDRKVNAMIQATVDHTKEAEVSILRVSEDAYRQTIFNAQMYASTGGTYEKAVDMATKDFLRRGIQCIRYRNNTYHSLEEYSEMALRTANTRAYLTGEGEMRNAWGEHLVIMNKRNCACPKCTVWCGKVLIDDVWSGGSAKDGNYPLMSTAIGEGLYHPNCKDIHTTYFPDLADLIEEPTSDERRAMEVRDEVENEYNNAQKQIRSYERLSKYSLDEENKTNYQHRLSQWETRAADLKEKFPTLGKEKGRIENKLKSP